MQCMGKDFMWIERSFEFLACADVYTVNQKWKIIEEKGIVGLLWKGWIFKKKYSYPLWEKHWTLNNCTFFGF